MDNEIIDVKSAVDPSTTESIGELTSPQQIPYSRFKEVNDKVKTLEEELSNLKTRVPLPPEEEPKTWQEVEERAVRKATAALKSEYQKEQEIDLKIDNHFKILSDLGHNLTENAKAEILKEMVRTGNDNLIEIYTQNKTKFDSLSKSPQQKNASFVPPSRAGSGTDKTPAWTYKDIKNKSIDDLISEAK